MKEINKRQHTKKLQQHLSGKFQRSLQQKFSMKENPMVRASCVWAIVSRQLRDVLGYSIYHKWFANILPMVISDNVLILQTQKNFDVRWINQHYHELIDLLISFQDKKLSSFIISPHETGTLASQNINPRPKVQS